MLKQLQKHFNNIKEDKKNFIIILHSKEIIKTIYLLKTNHKYNFQMLIDIFAVDYPEKESRFEINYNLLSIKYNTRIIIKISLLQNENIDSITPIFTNANWYEREVFDMYGINFNNHPDHRRILTDYNFIGHPMQKDFPLTGYKEVEYNNDKKKVIYKPVKLDQEYRKFNTLSPWEGGHK